MSDRERIEALKRIPAESGEHATWNSAIRAALTALDSSPPQEGGRTWTMAECEGCGRVAYWGEQFFQGHPEPRQMCPDTERMEVQRPIPIQEVGGA